MRWLARALLLAIVIVVALGWPALAGDPPGDVDFRRDVEYAHVGDETLRLDLSIPKGATGRLPAIVVIHGGAWRAGSRSDFAELTWRLAESGFVAATVGYRFCPEHRFPAQVQDVKCAVRFLRAHAEELHIDTERIGAVGFSAGAHLALMLGVMDPKDGLDDSGGSDGFSSKVQAVVSYFGPTDFELPATDVTRPLLVDFLGGSLDEARNAYHRASPVNYLDAGDAPMLLFQGTADPLVPPEHATRMGEAMQAAGIAGRVELLVGAGHGDWRPEELERTSAAMLEFLQESLDAVPPAASTTKARLGVVTSDEVNHVLVTMPFERIELERTECYGTCPQYKVTFNGDGSAVYIGTAFVEHVGRFTGSIGRYNFARLCLLLDQERFLELRPEYTVPVTDMPSCFVRAWRHGATEPVTVRDYGERVPLELWIVQQAIDGLAAAVDWKAAAESK